ncbi:DMT family transporter [Pikeienuella sp. HZG-20]|uniref:DMT family transporter n=1 Tax=Paludibacillus litoralis TaxID=3133267 RepID=UPI0030EB12FD
MSAGKTRAAPAGRRGLAVLAALVTVAIWANFLVTTGGAVGAGLGVVELGFLRAVVCAAALSPVLWRLGVYPKGLELWRFLTMVLGAGASFIFLMPAGFLFAPAADSGIFAPGVLPLQVAVLAVIFLGERIGRVRVAGFALISVGVFAVGGWDALSAASDGAWRGYLLFSTSSLTFACYTVAQRGSGLSALEATALISFWSVPIAGAGALIWGLDFSAASPLVIGWTALAQFGSGVVAIVTYTYAIIHLGPSRGAAFIALTPAVVALASDLFLGQPARPLIWAGVAVVSVGVLIASGVMERRRPAPLEIEAA